MFDGILDSFVDAIEAITPQTEEGRPWRLCTALPDTAPKTSARERRFALEVEPRLHLHESGPMSREVWLTKTVVVVTAYPLGKDVLAATKQIQRDIDLLVYTLVQPDTWSSSNDCEERSRLPTGEVEFDMEEDDAEFVIVRLPFETKYKLTFSS